MYLISQKQNNIRKIGVDFPISWLLNLLSFTSLSSFLAITGTMVKTLRLSFKTASKQTSFDRSVFSTSLSPPSTSCILKLLRKQKYRKKYNTYFVVLLVIFFFYLGTAQHIFYPCQLSIKYLLLLLSSDPSHSLWVLSLVFLSLTIHQSFYLSLFTQCELL